MCIRDRPYAGLRVKDGDTVEKGFALTEGALYPQDVLRVRGVHAVYDYLIQEVQKPYRQQGVDCLLYTSRCV